MNPYQVAMEQCAPPEGLQERLREKVCGAKPKKRRRIVIAALAAILILCMGANAIWDPLFIRRFGPGAALSRMGGATFQEVNVTAVCDDVELTVTQALCSENGFHLIFEYKLPDGVELREGEFYRSDILFYITGDYTWEEYRELEQEKWAGVDWSDYTSFREYVESSVLEPFEIWSGGSGGYSYDLEHNTIRCHESRDHLQYYDGSGFRDVNLTTQPLTVFVAPPIVKRDGQYVPLTSHPAIVTFQPAYDGPQNRSGTLEQEDVSAKVTLSPFGLYLEAQNMGYDYHEDMVKDTWLVKENGGESPVSLLGYTNGGGRGVFDDGGSSVSTTVHLFGITDTSEFAAVRMGEYVIPLE